MPLIQPEKKVINEQLKLNVPSELITGAACLRQIPEQLQPVLCRDAAHCHAGP